MTPSPLWSGRFWYSHRMGTMDPVFGHIRQHPWIVLFLRGNTPKIYFQFDGMGDF